eukprot:1155759-Pelagomonas_calceolata.AAC.3
MKNVILAHAANLAPHRGSCVLVGVPTLRSSTGKTRNMSYLHMKPTWHHTEAAACWWVCPCCVATTENTARWLSNLHVMLMLPILQHTGGSCVLGEYSHCRAGRQRQRHN